MHSAYELHREKAVLAFDEQLQQADKIRVHDAGDGTKLLFQLIDFFCGDVQQRLERDVPSKLRIVNAMYGSDRASSEQLEFSEAANVVPHVFSDDRVLWHPGESWLTVPCAARSRFYSSRRDRSRSARPSNISARHHPPEEPG